MVNYKRLHTDCVRKLVCVVTLEVECCGRFEENVIELDEALETLRNHVAITQINTYLDVEVPPDDKETN